MRTGLRCQSSAAERMPRRRPPGRPGHRYTRFMRPRRRLLLGLAAAVLVVLVGAIALVHLPPVQDRAWRRVVAAVEASTGWRAVAEDVALRGFPARLVVRGLTLSAGDRPALTVERLEARWSWWRLLRSPHRLESLVIEGPVVDTDALPSSEESTDDRASIDLFESFEVGSLRLVRGRAVGGFCISLLGDKRSGCGQ